MNQTLFRVFSSQAVLVAVACCYNSSLIYCFCHLVYVRYRFVSLFMRYCLNLLLDFLIHLSGAQRDQRVGVAETCSSELVKVANPV